MVNICFDRRKLFASISAFAAIPQMAQAEDYIDLEWRDLVPDGQPAIPPAIRELIQHDQVPLYSQ